MEHQQIRPEESGIQYLDASVAFPSRNIYIGLGMCDIYCIVAPHISLIIICFLH